MNNDKAVKSSRLGLRIVLVLAGLFFLMFGVGAFVSVQMLNDAFNLYGNLVSEPYDFTAGPLEEYVLRLSLVSLGLLGVMFFAAAIDPVRFGVLVSFALFVGVAYVVAAPVAGMMSGVSYRWFGLDTALAALMVLLLVVFRRS